MVDFDVFAYAMHYIESRLLTRLATIRTAQGLPTNNLMVIAPERRVYIAGYSAGAIMAYALAVQAPLRYTDAFGAHWNYNVRTVALYAGTVGGYERYDWVGTAGLRVDANPNASTIPSQTGVLPPPDLRLLAIHGENDDQVANRRVMLPLTTVVDPITGESMLPSRDSYDNYTAHYFPVPALDLTRVDYSVEYSVEGWHDYLYPAVAPALSWAASALPAAYGGGIALEYKSPIAAPTDKMAWASSCRGRHTPGPPLGPFSACSSTSSTRRSHELAPVRPALRVWEPGRARATR